MKNNKIENYSSIYLLARPLFLGIGISKIIQIAGNCAWISILIGSLIGLLFNYILTKLPEKSFKVLEILSLITLLGVSLTVIVKLIVSIYLGQTPPAIIIIPILVLMIYTVKKGKITILRATNFIMIIHILLYLIAAIPLIPTIKIDNFLPLFNISFSRIMTAAFAFAIYSTVPYITISDFKKQYNYKVYLISCLTMLLIFIIIMGSLGVELANIYRYPEYIIFKKISLLNFIENIENILFSIWFLDSFIICSNDSLKIKEKSNYIVLVISLLLILFIGSKYTLINNKYTNFFIKYYTYIMGGILLLFIISKLKGLIKKD